mgnify:CR=1 FL=1
MMRMRKMSKRCPKCGDKLRKIKDTKIKLPDSDIILHTKTIYECKGCFRIIAWVYLYNEWQFGREVWLP